MCSQWKLCIRTADDFSTLITDGVCFVPLLLAGRAFCRMLCGLGMRACNIHCTACSKSTLFCRYRNGCSTFLHTCYHTCCRNSCHRRITGCPGHILVACICRRYGSSQSLSQTCFGGQCGLVQRNTADSSRFFLHCHSTGRFFRSPVYSFILWITHVNIDHLHSVISNRRSSTGKCHDLCRRSTGIASTAVHDEDFT